MKFFTDKQKRKRLIRGKRCSSEKAIKPINPVSKEVRKVEKKYEHASPEKKIAVGTGMILSPIPEPASDIVKDVAGAKLYYDGVYEHEKQKVNHSKRN